MWLFQNPWNNSEEYKITPVPKQKSSSRRLTNISSGGFGLQQVINWANTDKVHDVFSSSPGTMVLLD